MKSGYTHLCIVLDASGSMSVIENDVKGSFNSFLKEQRKAAGKTVFDLFQFSDATERIVRSADLSEFKTDLMAMYKCGGCTALNDAVCTAIDTIGAEFAAMPEEERPEHVVFVIITDGQENASVKFTSENVKERITRQTEVYNWTFDFLAANQDAFETGRDLGIVREKCLNFEQTPESLKALACCMQEQMCSIRRGVDAGLNVRDVPDTGKRRKKC